MNRFHSSPIFLICLFALASPALGQTKLPSPAVKQTSPASKAAAQKRSEANAEAERVAAERRAQARSLLLSLASDARSFRDQTLRARTLARIADSLWDTDHERGRELFRKAWEAAETADHETIRKREEEIARLKAKTGGGYAIPAYPNMRSEVLRLGAFRDRKLGEEFLQSLKADRQGDVNGEDQRMGLAKELLATGDSENALRFASSELATINVSSVDFLTWLREKNAAAADERYLSMLEIAARNELADANTVSLLSSYLFTPHAYVTFHGNGESYSRMGPNTPPANLAPELRSVFFQTAANILLRPEAQPQSQTTVGTEGNYLILKHLLPIFEQYAPKGTTDAVRARFEALSAMVRESVRTRNAVPPQASRTSQQSADREQALLERIDRAKTSAERDRLYFQLATTAMERNDLSARDLVSKIDDSEFRKQVQAYVDISLATNLIHAKKIELALELIEKGALTHIQRVWLQTQVAKLLTKTDRDKSSSLLEDALSEARRIEGLDPDRPRALLAIANALHLIEPLRTRDAVFEAVKAANSADGFTGEDGALDILFQSKGFSSASDNPVPDFDIKGIFGLMATNDFDQAVELAHGFQGEAPRAAAVIAIARAVLTAKRAPLPATQAAQKN
ncbi:MAG TPA: hypothetical protein VNO50_13570 [Pyrinomonadaceae bacterium]|nr:hypothetical protein [Pyrinomonadaceae bacterium]